MTPSLLRSLKLTAALASALYIAQPAIAQDNDIPPVPEGKYMVMVAPTNIGVFHEYDTDLDGMGDYKTLRLLRQVTPHGLVLTKPFMYYVDRDRDLEYRPDEIYIDELMDGINGNEEVQAAKEPESDMAEGWI